MWRVWLPGGLPGGRGAVLDLFLHQQSVFAVENAQSQCGSGERRQRRKQPTQGKSNN